MASVSYTHLDVYKRQVEAGCCDHSGTGYLSAAVSYTHLVTNEEEISRLINEGKATFYIGFDPTADSLHEMCIRDSLNTALGNLARMTASQNERFPKSSAVTSILVFSFSLIFLIIFNS